eukprot:Skav225453  [mRNA]  locus=scaffold3785:41552:48017:- [translate_table: standard]
MIGTLSPALANFEESYSTLTFASTVKNIKIKAKPASAVDKDALVKSLQEELQHLKEAQGAAFVVIVDAIEIHFEATEALVERYRKGWEEAQSQAKLLMSQRGADLEKLGAPRWSWAVHSVLARTKESSCCGWRRCRSSEVCDFLVPHGLGIQEVTCYIQRDETGRLFLRPAASTSVSSDSSSVSEEEEWQPPLKGSQVAYIEVNGQRLQDPEAIELQHLDRVVLGRSVNNLDSDGATSVQEFLLMARKAAQMVEEANQITAEVKPGGQTNLRFELCAIAPILALGYGPSELAELRQRYDSLRDSIVSAGTPLRSVPHMSPTQGTRSPFGVPMKRSNDRLEEENQRLRQQVSELSSALQSRNGPLRSPRNTGLASPVSDAPLSATGATEVPNSLKGILDLSKANLLLVLDLFDTLSRLSSSMLNASAACLGTTPDDSPALGEARKRLAEASSDLAAFFAETWL